MVFVYLLLSKAKVSDFSSVLSFGAILTIVSEIGKTECIFTNLCVMQLLIYCKGGVFRYYILPVYGSDCKLAG